MCHCFNRGVRTKDELNELLTKEGKCVVVLKFAADWCAPCHAIASPVYANVRQKPESRVIYVLANREDAGELFDHYNVTDTPTFLLFNNSKAEWRLYKPGAREIHNVLNQMCLP